MNYLIDDFTVEYYKEKIDVKVWNHQGLYPIKFLKEYEKILKIYGFDKDIVDYECFSEINDDNQKIWMFKQKDGGYKYLENDEIIDYKLEVYDLIDIEIL